MVEERAPVLPVVLVAHTVRRIVPTLSFRKAARNEGIPDPRLSEQELAVDACGRVRGVIAPAVHDHRPDVVALTDVPLHTSDRKQLTVDRLEVRAVRDRIGRDAHEAKRLRPDTAREPGTPDNRDFAVLGDPDLATEEHLVRGRLEWIPGNTEIEDAGVLQKEVTLLGEEETEAGQVDLCVIHLDLREVRVHGQIEQQTGQNFTLEVEPDCPIRRRTEYVDVVSLLSPSKQRVRLGFDIQALSRQFRQALHMASAADPLQATTLPFPRTPQDLLVLAPDDPEKVDTPRFALHCVGVTKRAPGDRELGAPSIGSSGSSHLPDTTPVDIDRAPFVRDQGLELGSIRVGRKDHAVTVIVERVEHDREDVVTCVLQPGLTEGVRLENPVTLHDPGDHLIRPGIERPNGDIEGIVIVHDADLGALRRGVRLDRVLLAKSTCREDPLPERLIDPTVNAQAVGFGRGQTHGIQHIVQSRWCHLRADTGCQART